MENEEKKNQGKLYTLIEKECNFDVTRYNLKQYKNIKLQRLLHHDICKKVMDFAEKEKIAISLIVYWGVGTSARKDLLSKGRLFATFNEAKVKKVISWLKEFANYHNNQSYLRNDKVGHAFSRFYDKISESTAVFRAAKKSIDKMGNDKVKFMTSAQVFNELTKKLPKELMPTEE